MAAKKPESKLVSVVFKKPCGRYSPGDRAGFEPERAKSLIDRKVAVEAGKATSTDTSKTDSGKTDSSGPAA